MNSVVFLDRKLQNLIFYLVCNSPYTSVIHEIYIDLRVCQVVWGSLPIVLGKILPALFPKPPNIQIRESQF